MRNRCEQAADAERREAAKRKAEAKEKKQEAEEKLHLAAKTNNVRCVSLVLLLAASLSVVLLLCVLCSRCVPFAA